MLKILKKILQPYKLFYIKTDTIIFNKDFFFYFLVRVIRPEFFPINLIEMLGTQLLPQVKWRNNAITIVKLKKHHYSCHRK